MEKSIIRYNPVLTFIAFLLVTLNVFGQKTDNVILKAMKDEIHRNMDSLINEDGEKPFFIGYGINDAEVMSIEATLGALRNSTITPFKEKYIRVMAGGYGFNDESLDISTENPQTLNDIQMPVDDDYYGIRRALWASTDAVFKSASKIIKENKQYVERQNKPLSEIPHKYFAKVPVITQIIPNEVTLPDKSKIEDLVRDLSSLFEKYDQIELSDVSFYAYRASYYFVNSEGMVIQVPSNYVRLNVEMQTLSENGQPINENFSFYGETDKDIPPAENLKIQIQERTNNLIAIRDNDTFQDSYEGPVLFLGEASPDLDFLLLFGGQALVANKQIETNANLSYGGFNLRTSSTYKIGKKIISNKLSVISSPKMKEYQGQKLPGSYPIDAEGVIPPDELTLIKDGVLLNQLNDRTIADSTQKTNGNYRPLSGIRPGVIRVLSNTTLSESDLKNKLIEEAKSEGLDYAIIIRQSVLQQNFGSPLNIYKVDLESGKEVLLRNANIQNLTLRNLNKVIATTDNSIVSNIQLGREVVSIIAPDGILLEGVNIESTPAYFTQQKPLVPNPVSDKK